MLARIKNIIMLLIFYSLVLFLYNNAIAPMNQYLGYNITNISFIQNLIVLFFIVLPALFLPVTIKKPSNLIIWMLFLFSYLPTAFIGINFANSFTNYIILLTILNGAMGIFLWASTLEFNINGNFNYNFFGFDKLTFFLLILWIVYFVWELINFRFELNFVDIYTRRLEAREVSMGVMAYLISFLRNTFIALSVYLFFFKKKYVYLLLVLLGLLGVFIFDGSKTALIFPIILIGFGMSLRNHWIKSPSYFLGISIIVVSIAVLESLFNDSYILSEYFVRRVFVVPGMLNSFYFDNFNQDFFGMYFSGNYGNTFNVFEDRELTYYIGSKYFGSPDANANTGIWLTGFSQLGVTGVFIISFFSGLIASLINVLSGHNFYYYGALVGVLTGITWSEQALHTSMLTGGVFISIILMYHLNNSKMLNINW